MKHPLRSFRSIQMEASICDRQRARYDILHYRSITADIFSFPPYSFLYVYTHGIFQAVSHGVGGAERLWRYGGQTEITKGRALRGTMEGPIPGPQPPRGL